MQSVLKKIKRFIEKNCTKRNLLFLIIYIILVYSIYIHKHLFWEDLSNNYNVDIAEYPYYNNKLLFDLLEKTESLEGFAIEKIESYAKELYVKDSQGVPNIITYINENHPELIEKTEYDDCTIYLIPEGVKNALIETTLYTEFSIEQAINEKKQEKNVYITDNLPDAEYYKRYVLKIIKLKPRQRK